MQRQHDYAVIMATKTLSRRSSITNSQAKRPLTYLLQNLLYPHYCDQTGSNLEYVCFLKGNPVQLGTWASAQNS